MYQDIAILEQLLGRGNSILLSATLLIGLMLVLILRPNAIHRPLLFRAACWLLALAVVLPSGLSLVFGMCVTSLNMGHGYGTSYNAEFTFFSACANFAGPLLQGTAIICALTALMPPIARRDTPTGPAKHPLE